MSSRSAREPGQGLERLITPRSIALVGASERPESIGGRVLANLTEHSRLQGPLHLVNAKRSSILGMPCHPTVADLPEAPDVAVIAVPASGVRDVIDDCATTGVGYAIVLSSGLAEAGADGERLQADIADIAKRSGLRIYGPNCPGLCNVNQQIGMTLSPSFQHDLRPGSVGLVTQGGGLGRTVMQAMDRGLGIGVWASTGNEVDLDTSDFIDHFASAEDIDVIVTILEGIKDGPRFRRALEHAADAGKPVIALKIGRSEYGAKAAASHTASLTGSAEVNSAVMRQFGAIEVDDIDELVDLASLFARFTPDPTDPVRRGNRVAIYSSSGGTSALTADLVGAAGVRLCDFDEATVAALDEALPDYAATGNPVDTTAVILTDDVAFENTLSAVCHDPNAAMVLLPIAIDYTKVTEDMAVSAVKVQADCPVPIVPIWLSDRLGSGYQAFADAGMVPIRSIGKAAKAVRRYGEYLDWVFTSPAKETTHRPTESPSTQPHDLPTDEPSTKEWLRAAGIPVPDSAMTTSVSEAVKAAEQIGYPVVAKVVSRQILHKSDVGGVFVGIDGSEDLVEAWNAINTDVARGRPDAHVDGILIESMAPAGGIELLIGISRDPVFGHVMTFGLGGIHVELLGDVTRALLPIGPQLAESMIRGIDGFPLLDGARGRPKADIAALRDLLVTVSDLVTRNSELIEEVELNPTWLGPVDTGALVLDALISTKPGGGA